MNQSKRSHPLVSPLSSISGLSGVVTRRQFLKLSGAVTGSALLAGSLVACAAPPPRADPATAQPASGGRSGARPFEGRTITIFVYSGLTENTFRDVFAPAFEARTGAKVILSAGWWDAAAKLKGSPDDQPPFDLVQTDPTQGFPGIRDHLFTQVDLTKVPNAKNFAPNILDSFIYKDNWGLPFISSAMTLTWHKELVPDGLKTWKDLFSEGLKGKIMLYNAYYQSLFAFAAAKVDLDGKPGTAKQEITNNLDGVLQFAKEKRDWVSYWWPTTADGVNALLQKNVSAGVIHGNGLIAPAQDGKPIDFVIPPNDPAVVQLFFLVPRTSKNQDVALAAMDYFASVQNQTEFGLKTGSLSVNILSAAAEVAKAQPIWARVYPSTPAQFENLSYYPYDVYDQNSDKIGQFWDREVLRKS